MTNDRASHERRRKNDPQAMRGRILDAAAELFQARGYGDSAMQDITRAAGVTSGALHHHFPTKKALGLTVIAERVADAVADGWIQPVLAAPSAAEGVETAFRAIADGVREQGFVRGCPLNNLAIELAFADPDFRAAIQQIFDQWQSALTGRFRAEMEGSPDIEARAARLATFVIASYSGAMALAKAQQSAAPLDATLALLRQQLVTP